jgi:ATP-dependent RNA helicase DDX3X
MANKGKDNDPNNPLGMEDWIDEVIDPASLPEGPPAPPRNVVVLFGYLSDAQRFATRDPKTGEVTPDRTTDRVAYRLYRTPQLNDYLIIRHDDILHRGDVSEQSNAYGGSILWVKPEAQLQYVYTETIQAQASFLQGPLMGGGSPMYAPGPTTWLPGTAVCNASFACGGASFACGGGPATQACNASFACGGGSFACGGASFACGGASFACGGASFACGGGPTTQVCNASFACGGGSFACGGGSFACGGGSFACGGGSFACGGASFNCP